MVSKESLLVRAPQAILEIVPGGRDPATISRLREDWQRLDTLPAVASGNIHYLTNDYLLIPGTRIGLTAARFAEAIHPEARRD